MNIIIKNKRELHSVAGKILKHFPDDRIFAFYGAMGSGKTTIIKAICEVLGAVDIISSPSFTLVNEYKTAKAESLYHIDFYRIKKTEEVFDFGIEEYLSAGNYCFMEWPELVEGILPALTIKIRITVGKNEERILELP
jgi:tRNA threonylcarbamoyladenosine biosynthesis protein TsaE